VPVVNDNADVGDPGTPHGLETEEQNRTIRHGNQRFGAGLSHWAQAGAVPSRKTRVLPLPFNWKRLWAAAASASTPGGRKVRLFLSLPEGNVTSEVCTEFLRSLHRHVRAKVIVLWDRLPAHRSKRTQGFIQMRSRWLAAELLPAYAPELNTVEGVWACLSGNDLASYNADDLDALAPQISQGVRRLRRKHDSSKCFLGHSGLF